MKRTVRKLGQQDFRDRLKRVDGHFARHGYSKSVIRNRNERPMLWTFIAFVWIFFVISVAENRDYLEASLAQGSLTAELRDYVLYALTGLVVVSGVALGFHLVRFLFKGRDFRGASGSVLAGACGAILLTQAPAAALQDGVSVLTGTSQLLASVVSNGAQDITGIDVSDVRFVSKAMK